MAERIIEKEKIQKLLSKLAETYNVFAPVEEGGEVSFMLLENGSDGVVFDFKNTKKPLKEIFFPQTEPLFRFIKNPDSVKIEDTEEKTDKPKLLFGIRPCDVTGLKLLDRIFSGDYIDSTYLERRKNCVTVALTCNEPQKTCFCTSVGGSPSTAEADIMLTDLGGRFFARGFSDKGDEILKLPEFVKLAKKDKDLKKEIEKRAEEKIKRVQDMKVIVKNLVETFEKPYWNDISRKCINCFACTFLCPTCHCFDITDIKRINGGERVKTWDSCMSPLFTLHASGHNPRLESYKRWRQRLFHKFKYIPDNFGLIGCTGCGRCIEICPTGMDIRAVVRLVMEK